MYELLKTFRIRQLTESVFWKMNKRRIINLIIHSLSSYLKLDLDGLIAQLFDEKQNISKQM